MCPHTTYIYIYIYIYTDAKLSPLCDNEEEEEEVVDVSRDSPLLRGEEQAEGEGCGVRGAGVWETDEGAEFVEADEVSTRLYITHTHTHTYTHTHTHRKRERMRETESLSSLSLSFAVDLTTPTYII